MTDLQSVNELTLQANHKRASQAASHRDKASFIKKDAVLVKSDFHKWENLCLRWLVLRCLTKVFDVFDSRVKDLRNGTLFKVLFSQLNF